MIDYVVIMRFKSGIDMIGIIISDADSKVKIEHPFIIGYISGTASITMSPYCPLTDQTLFEFKHDDLQFLAPATKSIATRFIAMVSAYSLATADQEEEPESIPKDSGTHFIEGNETIH